MHTFILLPLFVGIWTCITNKGWMFVWITHAAICFLAFIVLSILRSQYVLTNHTPARAQCPYSVQYSILSSQIGWMLNRQPPLVGLDCIRSIEEWLLLFDRTDYYGSLWLWTGELWYLRRAESHVLLLMWKCHSTFDVNGFALRSIWIGAYYRNTTTTTTKKCVAKVQDDRLRLATPWLRQNQNPNFTTDWQTQNRNYLLCSLITHKNVD